MNFDQSLPLVASFGTLSSIGDQEKLAWTRILPSPPFKPVIFGPSRRMGVTVAKINSAMIFLGAPILDKVVCFVNVANELPKIEY